MKYAKLTPRTDRKKYDNFTSSYSRLLPR